jgi:AcrR family transcriptional regulator
MGSSNLSRRPNAPQDGDELLAGELTPPRVPRQARSRDKRDRLLAASLALFDERGYDATTIDAIAEQAGVSVGIFYSYFRSKRQMLLTLAEERLARIRLDVASLAEGPLTQERIAAMLHTFLVESRGFAGLHRARQELALTDPDVAAYDRRQQATVRDEIARGIAQRVAAGELRADVDAHAAATAILALIVHLRDTFASLPADQSPAVVRAAAAMVYHALVPDGAHQHGIAHQPE